MALRIIISFILATVGFYIMAWSNNFYAWEIWLTGYISTLVVIGFVEEMTYKVDNMWEERIKSERNDN